MTMKKKISEETALLEAVLAPHRSIAYDALTDIMMDALTDVIVFLNSDTVEGFDGWDFDRAVCGFRPDQMEKLVRKGSAEDLLSWVSMMAEQEKLSLLMAFLDWERLRLNDFRARYPNSFLKWSLADDEELRAMYAAGSSWRTMSARFGRNVNAIKLRLQHLGVDLGAEAARPRFPRRRPASGDTPTIPETLSNTNNTE